MRRFAILLILMPTLANAHARLTSPVPRNARDDVKDSYGAPCGGPRSTNVHVLEAGATLPVEWEETINHDGHFEILFSTANDQGFAFLKDPGGTVLSNIAHSNVGGLPRPYSTTVQLPAQPCDACTLQLKQFMSATSSYYYSCADVRLVPPGSDLATGPVDLGAAASGDLAAAPPKPDGAAGAAPGDATMAARGGCAVAGGAAPSAGVELLSILLVFACLARRRQC